MSIVKYSEVYSVIQKDGFHLLLELLEEILKPIPQKSLPLYQTTQRYQAFLTKQANTTATLDHVTKKRVSRNSAGKVLAKEDHLQPTLALDPQIRHRIHKTHFPLHSYDKGLAWLSLQLFLFLDLLCNHQLLQCVKDLDLCT